MDSLARFWRVLNDGTVEQQEPDGREIIASMKRAIIKNEHAEWSETCFCNPPLEHERATVYDQYFTEMKIEPMPTSVKFEGQPFWEYLHDHSNKGNDRGSLAIVGMRYAPIRII